jgi:ATP-binding cassette subfamily B protein
VKKFPAFSWVLTQVRDHKRAVTGLVAVSLLFAFAEWAEPQMLERFVNAAANGERDIVGISAYIVLLVLTALPLLFYLIRKLVGTVAFEVEQRLTLHLMSLDQKYFDQHDTSELMKSLNKGVRGTVSLIEAFSATSLLVQVPLAIMAAVFIAQYNVVVVLLLGLFIVAYLVVGMQLGKRMATLEKAENELDTVIEARREEMAAHMSFLQQQRATKAFYRASRERDERQLTQYHNLTWQYTSFTGLSGMVQVFAGLMLVFFFLPQVVRGDMPIGTFFALYIYMSYVIQPALRWGDIYAQVKSAWSETEPLAEFLNEKPVVVDREGAVALAPLQCAITFSRVSFAYKGWESQPVLQDVSITIPKGKMTAIVGESGGGKSTLAKLLLRQYDPLVGEIRFDNQSLTTATLASIYKRVAYMPQKPPIFIGSIWDNVDLRGECSGDQVCAALKEVQAHFISGQHDLDRPAHELSGGEQQRLALARLLLQRADVVVLDEATAALDQVTERGVVEIFDQLCRSRGLTQVVIAHRLSTVMHADQIVVMHEGRVAAVGTHEELLATSSVYQDLTTTFVRQD